MTEAPLIAADGLRVFATVVDISFLTACLFINFTHIFLPRDAIQSAIMLWQVVRLSVCVSVCDVDVPWSCGCDFFYNNYTNISL